MPATEAISTGEQELSSYELAFHVLPTVAEGEVPGVFDKIKAHITKAGGQITGEEAPGRFDLAYEIVKYLEGKNRKFSSAYFGWVRFQMTASTLEALTEEIDGTKDILRFLLIKLTKLEEANPFSFHESLAHRKVHTITDEEVTEESEEVAEEEIAEMVEGEEIEVEVEEESTDGTEAK